MPLRNSVTIIASPRPRVGKTLLARLLLDFHVQERTPAAGFDLNSGEGRLTQFLPEHASMASLNDVNGQMALFDRLIADDGTAKVIDLSHASFTPFFALADQIGFFEEAARNAIATAVLFFLTPDASSVEAFGRLSRRFGSTLFAPVHNEILGPAPHRSKYSTGASGLVLQLPQLAPSLHRYVAQPPFSFCALPNADIPLDCQADLQHWVRRVQIDFRELMLRMLLADLQSSIRISS